MATTHDARAATTVARVVDDDPPGWSVVATTWSSGARDTSHESRTRQRRRKFLGDLLRLPTLVSRRKPLPQKGLRARRDEARPSVIAAAHNATHNDERCHLNDALSVCTMASDHCGLLRTPSVEPARYRLQWKSYRFFVEKLAHERSRVHSDDMSNSGGGQYYWCLRHNRVETDADVCPASKTMGPYATRVDAEQALKRVAERNAQLDAEDARWTGEQP